MLNELYVTKNKYFDKHPRIGKMYYPFMGDSILFARNNELWAKKRKVMSTAFYKDKLIKYFEIVRQDVRKTLSHIREKYALTGNPMDIIGEIDAAHIRVQLSCSFGIDLS
jgi:cytochrome P450